jgi:hypothetical protein
MAVVSRRTISGELAVALFEDGAVLLTTTVVITAKAGIQYSPTPMLISESCGYWIARWNLSSGGAPRRPGGGR